MNMSPDRNEPDGLDLYTVAVHEAGHAVMYWLQGLPAPALTAATTGGLCVPPRGRADVESHLRYLLAGIAVETGYGLFVPPDLLTTWVTVPDDDIDQARRLLASVPWLRIHAHAQAGPAGAFMQSVDDALLRHLARACEMLSRYDELIQMIGWRLQTEGRLSARRVAAMCRHLGGTIDAEIDAEKRVWARLKTEVDAIAPPDADAGGAGSRS